MSENKKQATYAEKRKLAQQRKAARNKRQARKNLKQKEIEANLKKINKFKPLPFYEGF